MTQTLLNFNAAQAQTTNAPTHHERLYQAACRLALELEKNQTLSHDVLRDAMIHAFGQDERAGSWNWRDAYDAAEIASYLLIKRYWNALTTIAPSPEQLIDRLQRIQALMPSQTKRSEDQINLQQFSTPLALGYAMTLAGHFKPDMRVLEPSAGTGSLALWPALHGTSLDLNEIAKNRHGLLGNIFADQSLTKHNAAYIHAYHISRPMVDCVVMNPPFSADVAASNRKTTQVTLQHAKAAWQRLKDGGRLILMSFQATSAKDIADFIEKATIRTSIHVDGRIYQKYGGHIPTAIHVFDKNINGAPDTRNYGIHVIESVADIADIMAHIPPAEPCETTYQATDGDYSDSVPLPQRTPKPSNLLPFTTPVEQTQDIIELDYQPAPDQRNSNQSDSVFTRWQPTSIQINGAHDHPTPLAESTAMAAIKAPMPRYRPKLPESVIAKGILSAAQLEALIYAGEAHSTFLPKWFTINDEEGAGCLKPVSADTQDAFQLRQGWFLGDGTGAGKGRQVAGIILDNVLQGRKRALWVSKSATLFEDAKRDWTALGQPDDTLFELASCGQGKTIPNRDGILFTTYATLRRQATQTKISRLEQITNWLGGDFDGVIVFDESHALAGAAGGEDSLIGKKQSTQQGRAGLAIQNLLPNARIVYVSATGASSLHALAYANRLGLWAQDLFPFVTRERFIHAMEQGGVAAIEVVARDLKALGLYLARNLSYDGVEIDIVTHDLTPQQTEIYDKWAEAFQIIHADIEAALQSSNIVSEEGTTLSKQGRSNARSTFESTKQRFFNHTLTSMKCPSLFAAIDKDIEAGHAAIIQIVSTGEATLDRALDKIPLEQHQDLNIDVSPRDAVLEYLEKSFPVQMHQIRFDDNNQPYSEPMFDEHHNPVLDPIALAKRDKLIEQLVLLPPLPSALDQIIWRYGHEHVAEITGRTRRIIKAKDGRLQVQRRAGNANSVETDQFMDDNKKILIFSDAGGTGRSYHADKDKPNNRRRIHYLLEPGWRADAAIQGLGRSNRTNQASPPVFRPVTTNVKGEKRFIATIAKRLDTLGAITRGQKDTAASFGNTGGMFREEDNFESEYAKRGLTSFCEKLARNKIPACDAKTFIAMTGLDIQDTAKYDNNTPPMHTFLNRMLALRIDMQNRLFEHLEALISAFITKAKEDGSYAIGVETIRADSLEICEEQPVKLAISVREQTRLLTIKQTDPLHHRTIKEALSIAAQTPPYRLVQNSRSGEVAIETPTYSSTTDQGELIPRIQLIRPHIIDRHNQHEHEASHWHEIDADSFRAAWNQKLGELPTISEQTYYMLTGLLLPIWDRLPGTNPKIKRIVTNEGKVYLGRKLDTKERNLFAKNAGLDIISRDPADIWSELQNYGAIVQLADNLQLANVRFANALRIEVNIRMGHHGDWLKQQGCLIEVQSYKARYFVPNIDVLTTILSKYPAI